MAASVSSDSFYFSCSACGQCCDSAPQLSVPELFHHQRRFIGCLSLRRVKRVRAGQPFLDGTLASSDDEAAARALSERLFSTPPEGFDDELFLFTRAFSYASSSACPALGSDRRCGVHDDRKPGVCRVVPLEASLPDTLQRVVLGVRGRERRYAEASCITAWPAEGAREVTRRLKVVDQESSTALERRRADLSAEREHWGSDVLRLLSPELFRDPELWARLPEDGHFTLALVPVLTVLAGTSPRCRVRVIEYLHAQSELIQETLLDALRRRNEADRGDTEQLRSFLRANDAFAHVVERAPPKSWSASAARAERIETWLGC